MTANIYDRILLIFTLIVMSPLIIIALIALGIGYPLHLIKKSVFSKK